MRATRILKRGQQSLVEAAVVEEAGERVRLRLVLEARANLRVVECERRSIGEAPCEVEFVGGEEAVLTDPIDVQHALDAGARDQRDRDERLRVVRRARDEAHARVEVRLVHVSGFAAARSPAGDALVEADLRRHDLVRVLVAREHSCQHALRLVRLVDRERVVWDQVSERVGDAHEERVEALLCEHLVEHVGEPLVRLDELRSRREQCVSRHEPEMLGWPHNHPDPTIAWIRARHLPRVRERAEEERGSDPKRLTPNSVAPVEVASAIDGPEAGIFDLACGRRGGGTRCGGLRGLLTGPGQVHVGAVRDEVRINNTVHRLLDPRLLLGLEERMVLERIVRHVPVDRHLALERPRSAPSTRDGPGSPARTTTVSLPAYVSSVLGDVLLGWQCNPISGPFSL